MKVFDSYFEVMNHGMNTRRNKFCLRLPPVKLENAKHSFYYGGAKLFNSLPDSERKSHLSDFFD